LDDEMIPVNVVKPVPFLTKLVKRTIILAIWREKPFR